MGEVGAPVRSRLGRRGRGGGAGAGLAVLAICAVVASTAGGAAAAVPASPQRPAAISPVFQPIREVWAGGAAATAQDATAACRGAVSTLAMETCAEARTENLDVQIDAFRERAFRSARTAGAKAAINRDDAAWLANRIPVCRAGLAGAGGTIVGVVVATCEQDVSGARLAALAGRTVATAQLTATDQVDPAATQFVTAATGTRIGAIDTQGDQTGGVVIAWVVDGGYHGAVVDPSAFTYRDGTFVDRGVVVGHVAGHVVAPGRQYVFDIDYSRLAMDPHRRSGAGRFEYVSGGEVVAAWR